MCPEYLQLLSGPDVSECQREAWVVGSDIQNIISSKASVLFVVGALSGNNHLLLFPPLLRAGGIWLQMLIILGMDFIAITRQHLAALKAEEHTMLFTENEGECGIPPPQIWAAEHESTS